MNNHTLGPWVIRDDDEDGVVSIVGNSQIVLARVRTATVEPGDANARLIAAAPELLDALVAIKNQQNARYEVEANVGGWVWDAIAKATGA